jgi:hypothetical protein
MSAAAADDRINRVGGSRDVKNLKMLRKLQEEMSQI